MTDARYLAYKIKTECTHCGSPLVVNGPLKGPTCTACGDPVRLRPGLWKSLLEDTEKEVFKLEMGQGYNSTIMTSGFNVAMSYLKANPTCECEADWNLERIPTGTDGTFNCLQCGHESVTYPAPAWLTDVVPTASQIFFAERETKLGDGQVAAEVNDAAQKPIVFSCPQCAGALKLTAESERTVTCSFCDADVYLPDGLWAKLHPVKKAKYWVIRFEGDYQRLKAEMKARKKREKARQKSGESAGGGDDW